MTAPRDLVVSWGMVGAYVALNSLGALAIKHVVQRIGPADLSSPASAVGFLASTAMSPLVLLGLVAIGVSAAAWIVALSRLELSVAYPVAVALNCVIVVSAGLAAYGEHLSWSKAVGIVLLLVSLVLLFRA